MATRLELSPASYKDMQQMVEVIYAANRSPYDPFVDLFCPGLSKDSATPVTEGMRNTESRYLKEWKSSSTQHWLKVVDVATETIVSVTKWEIFDKDPYGDGNNILETKADWLPAGSLKREYAEYLANERYGLAAKRCRYPHVWLDICVTHPDYRRRGAASLGIQWGIEQADKLCVKAIVEATSDGASLYQKFGFETHEIVHIKVNDPNVSENWRILQEDIPLVFCWMIREPKS